jgi:hypothetical protein
MENSYAEGIAVALLSVAIMWHVLSFMVKSETENDMEAEFLRTCNMVRGFVAMTNFLGDSWLVAAALESGDASTVMHVKYMHELCSLLMHLTTYYSLYPKM